MLNLTKSFYVKRTVFNTKYPIRSEIKLEKFVFIHNSNIEGTVVSDYVLIEYNEEDIIRLMKLYKVSKTKKLKKLYNFITFCHENMMSLNELLNKKYGSWG